MCSLVRLKLVGALALALVAVACGGDAPPPAVDRSGPVDRGADSPLDTGNLDRGAETSLDSAGDARLCGGKLCDDKLPCTDDLCVASGCINKVRAGFCLISGKCYKDGQQQGSGCLRCRPAQAQDAWTSDDSVCGDDGLTCTSERCSAGACQTELLAGFCLVNKACHVQGAADPVDPCRVCDTATGTTSFTPLSDGTACTDDKLACTTDTCSAGKCVHALLGGNCLIGKACHSKGQANLLNECQVCDPASAPNAWSNALNGSACTDDGLSCTADECSAGSCGSKLKAGFCQINNTCFASGQVSPLAECQTCDPAKSTGSWTNKADGAACTADAFNCTNDRCNAGSCAHALKPNTCLINGKCHANGAAHPTKQCHGCIPSKANTAWSALLDGTQCGADLYSCTDDVCQAGACAHSLKVNTCLISGNCYKQGASHPTKDCLSCEPSSSPTSWSAAADDTACAGDAYACTDDLCKAGACTHKLKSGSCLIQGTCYTSGTQQPANSCKVCAPGTSATAWSKRADGAACQSDNRSCTNDVCSAGSCDHLLNSDYCLINGTCYAKGQASPGNDCRSCVISKSTTSWTTHADHTGCGGGECIGGSCCGGCVSGNSCYQGNSTSRCGENGNPCASCPYGGSCEFGKCFSAGCKQRSGGGCLGCDCQACVCLSDNYCCKVNWDLFCAQKCRNQCGGLCP